MINFKNKRNNWRDDINITDDMKFNSTFQKACIAEGAAALKWLSTAEKVNLAMVAQQTTPIDTAQDHQLHDVLSAQAKTIDDLKAQTKALQAKLNSK
tara:strand:- start:89 stop:379 length:291 start_codon:yes stop_codon:yes gene_type:complete